MGESLHYQSKPSLYPVSLVVLSSHSFSDYFPLHHIMVLLQPKGASDPKTTAGEKRLAKLQEQSDKLKQQLQMDCIPVSDASRELVYLQLELFHVHLLIVTLLS
jgi:hypothetical protein